MARAHRAGGALAQAATALSTLVSPLGRGRVAEVEALNRAAIVLLSAHLEGYLEDLYAEAASSLLRGRVKDLLSLVADGQEMFRNPQPGHVERLFRSIGLPKVLERVSWQRATNDSVRKRLSDYTDIRNKIAHGEREIRVRKSKVVGFKKFVRVFAEKFDEKVRSEIQAVTGHPPW